MPARFEQCFCGTHGRIFLANGFRGPEFCFRQHGLHIVRMGVSMECLLDEEITDLTRAILASSMPEDMQPEDLTRNFKAEIFNQFLYDHEQEMRHHGDERVHTFLYKEIPRKDIPPDFVERTRAMLATSKPN